MTFLAGVWVWYGGLPSLDFVNTCRNREAGRADEAAEVAEYLRGPDDFAAWLDAAGMCSAGPDGAAQAGPDEAGLDGATGPRLTRRSSPGRWPCGRPSAP